MVRQFVICIIHRRHYKIILYRAVSNWQLHHVECNALVGNIIGVSSFLTNSTNYLVAVFAKYRPRQTKVRFKAGSIYFRWCE